MQSDSDGIQKKGFVMKGRYHIRIENKRLQYDLEIRRNITVIRGDSATGKTTLVSMIQSYEDDGPASGVSIVCDKICTGGEFFIRFG
jgi:ABC-type thiamine transport system ATPase subunit